MVSIEMSMKSVDVNLLAMLRGIMADRSNTVELFGRPFCLQGMDVKQTYGSVRYTPEIYYSVGGGGGYSGGGGGGGGAGSAATNGQDGAGGGGNTIAISIGAGPPKAMLAVETITYVDVSLLFVEVFRNNTLAAVVEAETEKPKAKADHIGDAVDALWKVFGKR